MIFYGTDYTGYVVTGKTVHGKRFRIHTTNGAYAFGINLWRGSVWGIRADNGHRRLLSRIMN